MGDTTFRSIAFDLISVNVHISVRPVQHFPFYKQAFEITLKTIKYC